MYFNLGYYFVSEVALHTSTIGLGAGRIVSSTPYSPQLPSNRLQVLEKDERALTRAATMGSASGRLKGIHECSGHSEMPWKTGTIKTGHSVGKDASMDVGWWGKARAGRDLLVQSKSLKIFLFSSSTKHRHFSLRLWCLSAEVFRPLRVDPDTMRRLALDSWGDAIGPPESELGIGNLCMLRQWLLLPLSQTCKG